ncbi:hypothetical protein ABZS86_29840 [Streptomyces sp. NPDC005355]
MAAERRLLGWRLAGEPVLLVVELGLDAAQNMSSTVFSSRSRMMG